MKLRHRGFVIVVLPVAGGEFAARVFDPLTENRVVEDVYGRDGFQALELAKAMIDRLAAAAAERVTGAMEGLR